MLTTYKQLCLNSNTREPMWRSDGQCDLTKKDTFLDAIEAIHFEKNYKAFAHLLKQEIKISWLKNSRNYQVYALLHAGGQPQKILEGRITYDQTNMLMELDVNILFYLFGGLDALELLFERFSNNLRYDSPKYHRVMLHILKWAIVNEEPVLTHYMLNKEVVIQQINIDENQVLHRAIVCGDYDLYNKIKSFPNVTDQITNAASEGNIKPLLWAATSNKLPVAIDLLQYPQVRTAIATDETVHRDAHKEGHHEMARFIEQHALVSKTQMGVKV